MKFSTHLFVFASLMPLCPMAVLADQHIPDWGNASNYSVAGVHIDNIGTTVISGNMGSAYMATGFAPGLGSVKNGTIYSVLDSRGKKTAAYQNAVSVAIAASTFANDILNTAYYPASTDLSDKTLGTDINNLKPGIYTFNGDAYLSGTLTLDDGGDKNALYIFRIAGAFTTATASVVRMKSGGTACNVFWTASRNTILGAGSIFEGSLIGQNDEGMNYVSNITLEKNARVSGKIFTISGNISLNTNSISPIMDTDGDGVSDDLDDYPDNPAQSFTLVTLPSTVVFEDQWPSSGDFDMNDVVMRYIYKVITNSSNNVTEVIGTYDLLATGGSQTNAFGIEFPLAATGVGQVKAGKMESGQANAVFMLYSDMRKEMVNWNTIPGKPVSPVNVYTVDFMVKDVLSISDFKLDGYNPFILNIVNSKRLEIHLSGKQPTTLADLSMFGKGVDVSVPGTKKTYISKTGMPWALIMPMADFDYPVETKAINKGFTHFLDWAVYSGGIFPDWYTNDKDKISVPGGYRSASFIYASASKN